MQARRGAAKIMVLNIPQLNMLAALTARWEAEKAGHTRTAGQLWFRASNYLAQAERMLAASGFRVAVQQVRDLRAEGRRPCAR